MEVARPLQAPAHKFRVKAACFAELDKVFFSSACSVEKGLKRSSREEEDRIMRVFNMVSDAIKKSNWFRMQLRRQSNERTQADDF